MKKRAFTRLAAATCTLALAWPAHAQDQAVSSEGASALEVGAQAPAAQPSEGVGDIVVTARRRAESSLSVPVVLTAVTGEQLERSGVKELEGVARLVPQLLITRTSSVQGGSITLRGIGSTENNPFADQAVSINIDGVPISRASVARLGQLDLAQVEVLRGPQALFFGKNSPGGIIVMRSADPTPDWEARLAAGYEFVGDEVRTEGFVSGPLTENLGVRIAFAASHVEGWARNLAPSTGLYAPERIRLPHDREIAGRITLRFDPSSTFDARLKIAFNRLDADGPSENLQLVHCPAGIPFRGGPDDCRANARIWKADYGPLIAAFDPGFNGGHPFLDQEQLLSSLEMNFRPSDAITLTSVSAYYHNDTSYSHNASSTSTPAGILASASGFRANELSQEVRVASTFQGPLNFLVGAYAQTSRLRNPSLAVGNALAPFIASNALSTQRGEAYSGFAQLRFLPMETLELAGGGRYSYESKRYSAATYFGVPAVTPVTRRSFDDFSPEASITWRPTQRLTLFANYKRGFLSGGFNAGAGSLTVDRSYDQQTLRGFEGGVKVLLLDNTLRLNLAAYSYRGNGLQVSTTLLDDAGLVTQRVVNAGGNTTRGVDFDFTWRAARGLTLRGALGYNRSRYVDFNAPCYRGQTIALGCDAVLLRGVFTAQDLSGGVLARAPEWVGNAGVDYESRIWGAWRVGVSADAGYTDGYFTDPSNKPTSWQNAYWLLNASLRLADPSDRWELALIGRNLSNRYFIVSTSDAPLTGSGVNGTNGPTVLADTQGIPSRGRETMVRLSVRF